MFKIQIVQKSRCSIPTSGFRTYTLCNLYARSKTKQLPEDESSIKKSSDGSEEKAEESKNISKTGYKRKVSWVVPTLPPHRINEISTVAGVCVGSSHISWLKVSVPELVVLDWNAKVLPNGFRSKIDEPSILKMAYDINHSLPNADLYVMETFSMKGRHLYERFNEINLLSMLTVLLHGIPTDPGWKEKVVFQKKFVLNNLYDLLVGSERVSARKTVEGIISNCLYQTEVKSKNSKVDTSTKINAKQLALYKESELDKKEDLSLAFLLTLSFVDVSIFQNESSLLKVQNKKFSKVM